MPSGRVGRTQAFKVRFWHAIQLLSCKGEAGVVLVQILLELDRDLAHLLTQRLEASLLLLREVQAVTLKALENLFGVINLIRGE